MRHTSTRSFLLLVLLHRSRRSPLFVAPVQQYHARVPPPPYAENSSSAVCLFRSFRCPVLPGNASAAVGVADTTAEEPGALEAQMKRRAARRAEREKGIKARAIAAAESLGQGGAGGGVKMIPLADSVSFARDYKLGMAKKAR